MTVAELVERLNQLPQDLQVKIWVESYGEWRSPEPRVDEEYFSESTVIFE
jgi:hypothetical protein